MISCLLFTLLFQDKPRVDESLRVNYIMLDVIATDEAGRPVTDLTRKDFTVTEGRRKVGIDLFETLDFRSPEEGGPNYKPNEDPIRQTMVLVLDLAMLQPNRVNQTFGQLKQMFSAIDNRSDLQIFLFSLDMGLISQGFTDSPGDADADLHIFRDRFLDSMSEMRIAARSLSLANLETEMVQCLNQEHASAETLNRGQGMIGVCLENAHAAFASNQSRYARKRLDILGRLINILSRVEGLKSVYFLSPGFSLNPGHAAADLTQAYRQLRGAPGLNPSQSAAGVDNFSSNPGERSDFTSVFDRLPTQITLDIQSLERDFNLLSQSALKHRVIFHTFTLAREDIADRSNAASTRGIQSGQIYNSFNNNLQNGLLQLAQHTGGRHTNRSELAKSLLQTLDDHRFQYVIGYEKPRGGKRFRNIKVKCKRPGVVLHHRQGYDPTLLNR